MASLSLGNQFLLLTDEARGANVGYIGVTSRQRRLVRGGGRLVGGVRWRRLRARASDAGTRGEGLPAERPAHPSKPDVELLDRRHVLAAAAAAGASTLARPSLAADPAPVPVTPPDLTKCQPAQVEVGSKSTTVNCCVPVSQDPPKLFQPDRNPIQKVRRPAHLAFADKGYVAKYNEAYARMRALPDTDPRGFKQQADVHCAFCNGAYMSQQNTSAELQIHFSWLFFPWHRYYLYFHERILGSLIGDSTFALPFWNWDDQRTGGNVMPPMFTDSNTYPALYDAKRNASHYPPTINTLSVDDTTSGSVLPNEQIIKDNLSIMYQSVVAASTPKLFFGGPPLFGEITNDASGGSVELSPHTAIHIWAGDPNETFGEDMGNFYSAGRDPLFYSHHANVDRMWWVWNRIGDRRRDYTNPAFMDSSFVFYDEKGELTQCYVRDCINSARQLGISYTPGGADDLWLKFKARPLSGKKGQVPPSAAGLRQPGLAAKGKPPTEVATQVSVLVPRPTQTKAEFAKSSGLAAGDEPQEVLVLQDVKVPKGTVTNLAVFLNLPDAGPKTPLDVAEYVGSYANVPHLGMKNMSKERRLNVRFGISDALERLGLTNAAAVPVTVVAKVANRDAGSITIGGFNIEYD